MFDFDLENIKDSLDRINLESLLPDLSNFESSVLTFTRWAMVLGPLVVLALGVYYFAAAPREANYTTGYRCFFGMGSVQAWRFTQRLAGVAWTVLGLVLAIIAVANLDALAQVELMDAMFLAGKYILRQAVTVFVSVLCINVIVFARYDRKGIRRASWRELLGRDE